MKTQTVLLIIIIAASFNSCTVMGSLYPLSEDNSRFVFKKELLGKWSNSNNKHEFYYIDTVAGNLGKLYRIDVLAQRPDDNNVVDTNCLLARLIKIDQWHYLDCIVDEDKMIPRKKDIEDMIVAKHIIVRLSFKDEDNLEAAAPDPEELIKLIDKGEIKLYYSELKEDDFLILNKSAELEKATQVLNKYPNIYKSVVELKKLK